MNVSLFSGQGVPLDMKDKLIDHQPIDQVNQTINQLIKQISASRLSHKQTKRNEQTNMSNRRRETNKQTVFMHQSNNSL